jgi:hypothetical protein
LVSEEIAAVKIEFSLLLHKMDLIEALFFISLIVLFSPIILGVLILGWQKKVLLRHRESGLVRNGYFGWSWTYQIFGWLVPVVRGEIVIAVMHLVFTIVTFGLFQIVMPFLYNKQYMTRLLTDGWEICDTDEVNVKARNRLGIIS